jgi:hypothetical protein
MNLWVCFFSREIFGHMRKSQRLFDGREIRSTLHYTYLMPNAFLDQSSKEAGRRRRLHTEATIRFSKWRQRQRARHITLFSSGFRPPTAPNLSTAVLLALFDFDSASPETGAAYSSFNLPFSRRRARKETKHMVPRVGIFGSAVPAQEHHRTCSCSFWRR